MKFACLKHYTTEFIKWYVHVKCVNVKLKGVRYQQVRLCKMWICIYCQPSQIVLQTGGHRTIPFLPNSEVNPCLQGFCGHNSEKNGDYNLKANHLLSHVE